MSDQPNRYVVAYDIVDDKRRSRVAKYLQQFGVRAQFSVFLCDLRPARMNRVAAGIEDLIEVDEDSVMVCRVGVATSLEPRAFVWLGRERPEPPTGAIIV